jgi:hypothetical protein
MTEAGGRKGFLFSHQGGEVIPLQSPILTPVSGGGLHLPPPPLIFIDFQEFPFQKLWAFIPLIGDELIY